MNSFRAVQEIWATDSACFLESDALTTLLHDLAARVGTRSDDKAYGEMTKIWFKDGNKVLDYIETDTRFNQTSFCDSLAEQGVTVDVDDLKSLIQNMKSLAPSWRDSLGSYGELVFYIA